MGSFGSGVPLTRLGVLNRPLLPQRVNTVPAISRSVARSAKVITYCIITADGAWAKIGITKNLAQRLRQLQTDSPFVLGIYGYVPGNHEKTLHRRFAHLRSRGEWFACSLELLKTIDFLKHTETA